MYHLIPELFYPQLFTLEGIKYIEQKYKSNYIGYWQLKDNSDTWSDIIGECFYCKEPDTSKQHSNYFALFKRGDKFLITNAENTFLEPIQGIVTDEILGSVIVSRYKHDFVSHNGFFIDGGRNYTKTGFTNSPPKMIEVSMKDGEFYFDDGKTKNFY